MSKEDHKKDFARQGSWMVITTFLSGVCMLAVHVFAPILGDKEYGLFGALLAMVNLMAIPGLGLQSVFAQQTAAAVSFEEKERLTVAAKKLLAWTFFLWFGWALFVFIFQKKFSEGLSIAKPVALWMTILIGLTQLWGPILTGILQGQQKFWWMGWVAIANGLGRFIAVAVIVLLFHGRATGAITGTFLGISIGVLIAALQSRAVWLRVKPQFDFDWRSWLARIVPLTLGLGAGQFILSADMIFVRAVFGQDQTGIYSASGMFGRGLVAFAAPLTMVMFPKIVHNISHGKKTNVLGYTLLATAVMCGLAAALCTVLAIVLKHFAASPELLKTYLSSARFEWFTNRTADVSLLATLITWFVWCMLPLALANVLLNNLMARKQFRVVPYLLLVIAGYFTTLTMSGGSFVRVIQVLGIFNFIFLAVIAIFTWGGKTSEVAALARTPDLQEKNS